MTKQWIIFTGLMVLIVTLLTGGSSAQHHEAELRATLGPFTHEESQAIEMALRDRGISFSVRKETSRESLGFIVTSPQVESTSAGNSLVAQLKQSGINDVLYMPRGAFQQRVSAGVYPTRIHGERRVRELQALGFNFEVLERATNVSHTFLDMTLDPVASEPVDLPQLSDGGQLEIQIPEVAENTHLDTLNSRDDASPGGSENEAPKPADQSQQVVNTTSVPDSKSGTNTNISALAEQSPSTSFLTWLLLLMGLCGIIYLSIRLWHFMQKLTIESTKSQETKEHPFNHEDQTSAPDGPDSNDRWRGQLSTQVQRSKDAIAMMQHALRPVWPFLEATASRVTDLFAAKYPASTRYRYLARQIASDLVERTGCKNILFCSNEPFQVNSEILMMFAYFLQDELACKVLIIDGTFRDEGVTSTLGHQECDGFINLFHDAGLTWRPLIKSAATNQDIFILPAGNTSGGYVPITQDRIEVILEEVGNDFDYILIQQGPITLDSRYLLFSESSDLVLWHVAEGTTPLDEYHACLKTFRDHRVENVRVVLSE